MVDREDYRCFVVMFGVFIILVTAPYTTPIFVSFVAFIIYYWFITVPVIITGIILYRVYSNKKRLTQLAESFDNLETQTVYESSSGKVALEGRHLTKEYRLWLIRDVPKKKPSISKISPKTYLIVIIIIISLALFSYLLINLYSFLFNVGAWYS